MKQAARRFDMYLISMDDVERLGAWKSPDEVRFTHADTGRLRRVRKRNTALFDTLTDLCGHPYEVGDGVLTEMLLETIVVDFRQANAGSCVRCLRVEDENAPGVLPPHRLQQTLFEKGFYIGGGDEREIHFVPFVASASMSREEEYLFVNSQRLDALLRAVTLDMVSAAEDMPVLNGLPRTGAGAFGGLESRAKVASVPKLAAYMGLALSDGVSLRERLTAWDHAALPEMGEGPRQLLGMNEWNTVCVDDWSDAPMGLERFPHCWVNEEAPLEKRYLPSTPAGGAQGAGRQQLQALFAALAGDDRQPYDALVTDASLPLWEAWREAIDLFFAHGAALELPQGRVPAIRSTVMQGASLNACAALYAACLAAEEGEYLLTADEAHSSRAEALSAAALRSAIGTLAADAEGQNQLWNLLHEHNPSSCRVITAEPAQGGLRFVLERASCRVFRAALRRIGPNHRLNRGNQYDGCGFMDDGLFDALETLLLGRPRAAGEEPLNAVQIRLPWCKGLLVRFSAAEYFRAWAAERGLDWQSLAITDVFGHPHPLADAQGRPQVRVVFTASMFKGVNWFRHLEYTGAGECDRWAEYWRRLRSHGAALLIAGKSTPSRMASRLNYQFLSTNGMEEADIRCLARKRFRQLAEDRTGLLWEAEEDSDETDDLVEDGAEAAGQPQAQPDEEEAPEADYLTLLGQAVRAHPGRLAGTDVVASRADALLKSETLQMMRGRLPVEGDVRYLLPDLMASVRYMAERFLCLPDGSRAGTDGAIPSAINDLGGDHPQGCYYAPGDRAPWLRRSGKRAGERMPAAMLRNPHYAAGEEPVLAPLDQAAWQEYDRWFRQLTGCVMAPNSVMYTINGADCDGDRVNLCPDRTVVRAIRRRGREDGLLLRQVIRRKQELTAWLEQQAQALPEGKRRQREYLLLLARELPGFLPPWDEHQPLRDFCPPLLYAGSEAKGAKFSRDDMQGVHLRDKLWEAFDLSRRQRIGRMSLELLRLTPDAYRALPEAALSDDAPPEQLLSAFLARYLVVSGALDTAMEIDMAKSGLQRGNHPLKSVPRDVQDMLGHARSSGFAQWRRLYLQRRGSLMGYRFRQELNRLMADASRKHTPSADGALALDLLPGIIHGMWEEAEGGLIRPERIPLKQVLAPPAVEVDGALLQELREAVRQYDCRRRLIKQAETAGERVHPAYEALLGWLLRSGAPLEDALSALDTLRAMLMRWHADAKAAGVQLSDALEKLHARTGEDALAIRWGWASPDERAGLLRQLLAECSAILTCTAQEAALLNGGGRSIALVRLLADYGRQEMLLMERSALMGGASPEELEGEMHRIIARHAQENRQELFYAACLRLYRMSYAGGDGKRHTAMSDFLMTWLLRRELKNRIVQGGGEGA